MSEKNRTSWNKGLTKETDSRLSQWNKGLTKGTDSRIKRMSESRKGGIPWNKGKKMGQIAWNKGLTSKTDDRIKSGTENNNWKGGLITKQCEICSNKFPVYPGRIETARFCSIKCMIVWRSQTIRGAGHPQWKGGTSFEPYPVSFTEEFKELIRYRDGYKCQRCGCPEIENSKKLSVHHIDYNKENCRPSNLISLCNKCNAKVNFSRARWQHIFHHKIQKLMSTHPLQLNFRVTKPRVKGGPPSPS